MNEIYQKAFVCMKTSPLCVSYQMHPSVSNFQVIFMYTFWEFERNRDRIYPFLTTIVFFSLISIFGTKSFIVQLSKRIIFEGVVLLNCRKKQSAIYSVCMEHPHMTLKCCSAVSRALTFSFNWMIRWKVTMNVSKNLRGECHPKNQIKRDNLVMLKGLTM